MYIYSLVSIFQETHFDFFLIVATATVIWALVGMTTGLNLGLEIGLHTLKCITHIQEPTLPLLVVTSSLSPSFASATML